MIKRYTLIFFICIMALPGIAQIRHVQGIRSIDAAYGFNKYGSTIHVGYVMYLGSKFYLKGSPFYETKEQNGLKQSSIGIDLSGQYSVLHLGESFWLNLKGGLCGSFDKLNPGIKQYDQQGNETTEDYAGMKFGVLGGFEGEYYFSDRFTFIFGGHEKFLLKKDNFGQVRWVAYGGIRFKL